MTPNPKPFRWCIPVVNFGEGGACNDANGSWQPIIQFKELAVDRVRYDQYKALCRQQQRKETER